MRVEIFADIVCPWCYIGERRFENARAAVADTDITVEYRPYQLDPHAPETALPLKQYLENRYGFVATARREQVSAAATGVGITIDWDRALAVNTRTAHRLMRLARMESEPAVQRALLEQLFAAHFTHGVDIADHEQLAELAESAGMAPARVRQYLASHEGADAVERELNSAREIGIDAVPTFLFEEQYVVQGAQSEEVFHQVFAEVQRLSAAHK